MLKMNKVWVVTATLLLLCCSIAIGSCHKPKPRPKPEYETVRFTTDQASVGSYQSFISSVRSKVSSGATSHGIPILPKPSDINDNNMFLLVELINYNSKFSVTVAVNVTDLYVIGYKSESRSFFLKDAPQVSESLLFDKTDKTRLQLESNYAKLGNRYKIPLGIGPLKKAIDTLHDFDGRNVNEEFRHSIVVVAEMVSEATRFKLIEKYILNHILDEYTPGPDTVKIENSWSPLSERIQQSGPDGSFRAITLKNADNSDRIVTNVAQVRPDIAILLYKESEETPGESKIREIYAEEEVVEEWLPWN